MPAKLGQVMNIDSRTDDFDVIIIGERQAGLSAALYMKPIHDQSSTG
jgi:hypothetical protein